MEISDMDTPDISRLFQDVDPQRVQSRTLGYDMARPWTTSGGAKVLLPQTQAIQQLIIDLLD